MSVFRHVRSIIKSGPLTTLFTKIEDAIGKALESLRLESDSSGTNTDEVGADLSSLVSKPSPKSDDSGEKDLKNINDETLSSIVDLIKSDKCKNVIFMVGAGISTCKC